MKLKFAILASLALLLLSTSARAQTNYCDTVPPTSGTAVVGITETVNVCIAQTDTNGNPITPTLWTLYNSATGLGPIVMTKGTTGQNGLVLYTGTFTFNTAGTLSLQITATGNGKESAKSAAFLLTVSNPPSAPQTPVKLSTQ